MARGCRGVLLLIGLVLTCALGADKPAPKVKDDPAFKAAKKAFQAKVKSKVPQERIDALKLLDPFPTGESVELMWHAGLGETAPAVRLASIRKLASWIDKPGVARWVLGKLDKTASDNGLDQRCLSALHALGCSEKEEIRGSALLFLDTWLGTPQADQRMIHTWIDELGTDTDASTVRALRLLSKTKLFPAHFGFRRCVVQAVTHIQQDESLSLLIDLLADMQGLIQSDIIAHLTAETGENFKGDLDQWRGWWMRRKPNTRKTKKETPPGDIYGPLPKYYNIPICAKRVVFVLDTSSSMRGAPLAAAKAELIEAIKALPVEVQFSVIGFNSRIKVWQNRLVPATVEYKSAACQAVQGQEASGETASFDALEAAFELAPEAIYFLSDGAPKGGKISDPVQIVNMLFFENHVRRVSIYTLGVGVGTDNTTVFGKFMRSLAETNWGDYHSVP